MLSHEADVELRAVGEYTSELGDNSSQEGTADQLGGWSKRTFDIVVSLALLVFFAPLMVVIALIIRFGQPGPIVFGHFRIGFGGHKFKCLKFRSMTTNSAEVLTQHLATNPEARAEWAETQKLRDDPRITKIGRILRESSLDELPQLFNVLRGEMSLVGPRPIVDEEVSRYGADFGAYRRGRPGITGLWQVSGRSNCSYAERVQMDVRYVDTWSFRGDLSILLRTVFVVLKREGSR